MSSHLPIVLSARTLGDRHRELNGLVEDAFEQNLNFESLENAPETSPLDRLFKIDVASKYRLIDYILKNLKDEDMLYVSRALKCRWLLEPEYIHIINPTYLEEVLFPEMQTTAVNKMRHWIHLHLHDPQRCQQFYECYATKKSDLAVSFLWRCSNEFILREVQKILPKITPRQLKILVEKCPQVGQLYFDSLDSNKSVIVKYLKNETDYYNSLKCLIKTDTDLFLDITEKYFNTHCFPRLSSSATKFIIQSQKNRFMSKPELYIIYVLDVKTLAENLNSAEIKDIITRLARAEYTTWFSYKNVEPLIMQLEPEERREFKKSIFVDKSFGEKVQHWPYETPYPPELKANELSLDIEHDPEDYEPSLNGYTRFPKMLKKRKYKKWGETERGNSLDKLFERFRFQNFNRTFHVLRKEILATINGENRMKMLLVLVSKSGSNINDVQQLLTWLIDHHSNEIVTLRAAVVRSLVKRASVWRLPETSWQSLLRFARGLGLDGTDPETDCIEGLHAVIIRNVLFSTNITSAIFEAYLRNFSTLSEYALNKEEKFKVIQRLPSLLLAASDEKNDEDTSAASKLLVKVLDVLKSYSVPVRSYACVLPTVKRLAQKDPAAAEEVLLRLYHSRIARKHLICENFDLIQSNASYLNALRHEPDLLTTTRMQGIIGTDQQLDGFLRKLTIYFNEESGLAVRLKEVIEEEMKVRPRVGLARPIAILAGTSLMKKLEYYDGKSRKSIEKQIARSIKANAHAARPKLDINQFGWRKAGVMAIANKVTTCSAVAIPVIVEKLLLCRRTARLALKLAIRGQVLANAFPTVAKSRPSLALRVGLTYIRDEKENYDKCVWDLVKALLTNIDISSCKYLQSVLSEVDSMPKSLRAEYSTLAFKVFRKFSLDRSLPILCYIENILPDINAEFVSQVIIKDLICNNLKLAELELDSYEDSYVHKICLFVRIIAKYLLLCRSEEEQIIRIENVGKPFLDILKLMKSDPTQEKQAIVYFYEFITSLQYAKVYINPCYVSCIPVMAEVEDWMNEIFPLELWPAKHFIISFNIILFKAIRLCTDRNPQMFLDSAKVSRECLQMVGVVFGKLIADDIKKMESEMFSSILDLYWSALKMYLDDSFRSNKYVMAHAVRNGLLHFGCISSFYLAERLDEEYYFDSSSEEKEDYVDHASCDDPELSFYRD